MSENLKKFLEQVSKDETLKQKVLDCNEMEKEDAIRASIALAKEVGIELTEADFAEKEADNELSDDEMDAVAGGGCCGCSFAGGGGGTDEGNGKTYGCACVMYGQGGDGRADDFNCMCIIGGCGHDWNYIM
ncbi:MAG: Nif11-like leader peptide family RiPP precursor [Lachnospiraceae bacterium]